MEFSESPEGGDCVDFSALVMKRIGLMQFYHFFVRIIMFFFSSKI